MILQEKFEAILPGLRDSVKEVADKHGDKTVSEVSVKQLLGGMRGVKSLLCETSYVDPIKGLIIRGRPLAEVSDRLPEEILFLLLTGDLPEGDDVSTLKKEFADRMTVPGYVWDMLRGMHPETHPMTMFSAGILAMQKESQFVVEYDKGINKLDYWKPAIEDTVTLVARLAGLAAGIYRIRFNKGDLIDPDPSLDLGANFAHMTGIDDPDGEFKDLMRLYFTLHCDHEGGNVSAFATHVVGSALSDPYYALSAGMNGLAGPLHGLANQECLKFVQHLVDEVGGTPSKQQVIDYAWETLNSGRVIPGYGHAVLRATDPRFTAFHDFGEKHLPESPAFKTVSLMFETVPDILKEQGKAKSPWPNVDAVSGSLLYHYGLKEYNFYTVLFGVSRAMGVLSQLVINRAILTPITRPKSVTVDWIKENV